MVNHGMNITQAKLWNSNSMSVVCAFNSCNSRTFYVARV